MSIFEWIFAKFQPEKCDLDLYKGFLMEKMTQIPQIFCGKNNSKFSDFKDKFQKLAKNMEGSFFWGPSFMSSS